MKLSEIINFYLREIDSWIWFKVFINFLFYFAIIISEILFLSSFFLILNKETGTETINIFFSKLEFFVIQIFDNLSITAIYILILIFFLLLKNILSIFQLIFYNNFIFKLAVNKSSKLLNSYLLKTFEEFSKTDISIYTKQLVRDVEGVFVGIFGLIITFTNELIYVIILIIFISQLVDFSPGIEVFLILVSMLGILYLLYIVAKKFGDLRATSEITVFKTLTDTLNVFKEIKIIQNSKDFIFRYKNYLGKYYKSRVASGVINIIPKFMFEFFLLLFFFVVYIGESENININDFVLKYSVFALALLRLIPSFAKLSAYTSTILYSIASVKFINKDLIKKVYEEKEKKIEKKIVQQINFKKVKLNFLLKNKSKKNKDNGFNFTFQTNKIYGIYGASGSGKTSILNLLSGFIKPSSGLILINGKEYKSNEITKKFNIGYAPQMPTIIDEDVITNVTLKYNNSPEVISKLKQYLLKFNLKRFTRKKYYNNYESLSIKNMSGGERQRIGFIRSVINNPSLILLDEPTSSLDKKNETKIFTFLKRIKQDKIIIITSHNKNHKKYFDQVINLN